MTDAILIRGAREHNLKNITLSLPRNKLIVITGLSGSGKSSLAFDTIYAEGQRRYVESLSAYARQFLELMEKPDVDFISGLSPAISIEQRNPSHNPRSTVGTVTEIYDYLRLLFARIGIPHCVKCGRRIQPQSASQIIQSALALPAGEKIQILSPLVSGRIGTYQELFAKLSKSGYARVRVNKKIYPLEEPPRLDRYKKHTIELVVDRLVISSEAKKRLADSVETALKESRGTVIISRDGNGSEQVFSEHHACTHCGLSLGEIEPRLFSFNSPYGACSGCGGIGTCVEVDEALVVPEKRLSVENGALLAWADPVTTRTHRWKRSWGAWYDEILEKVCGRHSISRSKPFESLPKEHQKILLYGDGDFEGIVHNLERRHKETESEFVKEEVERRFMRRLTCDKCHGARLKSEALAVTLGGKSITQVCGLSIKSCQEFFKQLSFSEKEKAIGRQVLKEIEARLSFLVAVGLDYLTLHRESSTLAGGEAQRIHLATQIGSGLTGVLYVLDEPTIGLHQRDNKRLLETLFKLRDLGNSLVVVEHDEETIRSADWIVDLGPGAGEAGGAIVAEGPLSEVLKSKPSLTGKYLRGELKIPVPKVRRTISRDKILRLEGASQFNLKGITVDFPLETFICITGVSGSGKSTLIQEILYKALAQKLYHFKEPPGKHKALAGTEHLDKVIVVDQSPIGRTPRSNPATYTGVLSPIRDIFSELPDARRRGWKPGRFSFNVKGGRCENCQGDGTLTIEMQFLPDVYVTCEVCRGARFNEETLEVRYKGKNISEVLKMPVSEALLFFENIPNVKRVLATLADVGLGYIALGQAATTLSGGEAQRVKLATELSRRATGQTLYILDEPTTGLHFADVEKLLNVLHRLVDAKNTVIVIEHNLDVVKTADWVIDLGPEGGDAGGFVVASGPPESLLREKRSYTGQFLKRHL